MSDDRRRSGLARIALWGIGGILILGIAALAYPLYSHYFPTNYDDLDGDWKQQDKEQWLYVTEGRWYSAHPLSEEVLKHPNGTLELVDGNWVFRDSNGHILRSSVNGDAKLLILSGETYGRIER